MARKVSVDRTARRQLCEALGGYDPSLTAAERAARRKAADAVLAATLRLARGLTSGTAEPMNRALSLDVKRPRESS